MFSKRTLTILISVVIFELLILLVLLSQVFYVFAYNDLEVKQYEIVALNLSPINKNLTKSEAKELVASLYNVEHSYIETNNIPDEVFANSNIYKKEVKIRPDLPLVEYTVSYAHELTHIKYRSHDETYTAYKTFVDLYESGNEDLQNISLVYAQSVINGCYSGTEYDCGYYILEYLHENNAPVF